MVQSKLSSEIQDSAWNTSNHYRDSWTSKLLPGRCSVWSNSFITLHVLTWIKWRVFRAKLECPKKVSVFYIRPVNFIYIFPSTESHVYSCRSTSRHVISRFLRQLHKLKKVFYTSESTRLLKESNPWMKEALKSELAYRVGNTAKRTSIGNTCKNE